MKNIVDVAEGLSAPIKSFRIFAMEEILRTGNTNEILDALEKRQYAETDPECQILLTHAILAVKERLAPKVEEHPHLHSVDVFSEVFSSSPPGAKVRMLLDLSAEFAAALSSNAPHWLEAEADPTVQAFLIRTFHSKWPLGAVSALTNRLWSTNLQVQLAALDCLVRIAPEPMREHLPRLLSSPDPLIRALAVQALANLDMEEAIRNLESMLWAPDPHSRMCAIQSGFYLPFQAVKPSFLKFLSTRPSSPLLERACMLFEINPDPEVPFHLLEIAEASNPQVSSALRRSSDEICRALKDSGVLGEDLPRYEKDLSRWVTRRSHIRELQGTVFRATSSGSPQELRAFLRTIAPLDESWREALAEAGTWDLSETVRETFEEVLGPGLSRPGLARPGPATQAPDHDPEGKSPAQLVEACSSLRVEDRESAEDFLGRVIRADHPVSVHSAALRAACRLNCKAFGERAESLLQKGDEALVTAAIEYLSSVDPDRLFPLLGKFLNSESIWVRSTAVTVLGKFDPERAIALQDRMLQARDPFHQGAAIACLLFFDFPLVRDILFSFLARTSDIQLFRRGLTIVQANPDTANLLPLHRLSRTLPPPAGPEAEAAFRQTIDDLRRFGLVSAERAGTLLSEARAAFEAEEARKKCAPPVSPRGPTGPEKLPHPGENGTQASPTRRYPWATGGGTPTRLPSNGGENSFTPLGIAMMGAAIICLLLVGIFQFANRKAGSVSKASRGGALLPVGVEISGTVVKRERGTGTISFLSGDGRAFLLILHGPIGFQVRPGSRIRAQVRPLRMNPGGVIVADVIWLQPDRRSR